MSNKANSVTRRSVPCYFCSEFLEERYLTEHVKHCGAVLEECPYKCGVYVPRRHMESHQRGCDAKIAKKNDQSKEGQEAAWRSKVFAVLTLLRSEISEGERHRQNLEDSLSRCLSLLNVQQESINSLRMHIMEAAEECQQQNKVCNQRLNNLELSFDSAGQRTSMSFQQISEQLELLQGELTNDQNKHDEVFNNWCLQLRELKAFLTHESLQMTNMWQEQQRLIHDLKLELEMRCKSSKTVEDQQEELSKRMNELIEETEKHAKRLDDQKSSIKGLKFQTKENLTYLEELIRDSSKSEIIQNPDCSCLLDGCEQIPTNGRLLWRIDRYKERMTDAKEIDCALYSSKFYNKEYGYTLRMELFLNGRGQWKDRHIIGCLRVENGKWDPLLDWPCILRATVTLRDQENPANDIRKLVKTVGQDRNDSDKLDRESGIYMFIPHSTLTRRSGYTKNNIMFLDIQVRDVRTSSSTTSLLY